MNPNERPNQLPNKEKNTIPPDSKESSRELLNNNISQFQKQSNTSEQHPIRNALIWTTAILISLIGLAILFAIIFVIATFANLSKSHGNELDQLEKDTVSLFSDAKFAPASYDCHDVELRNQCFFSLDTSSSNVEDYLLQNGFSKDEGSGSRRGYDNGSLYVINIDSKGRYTSYHIAKQ